MIAFWENKDGNFRCSELTQEEIEFIQELKIGDRLVLFKANPEDSKRSPDFKLRKVKVDLK